MTSFQTYIEEEFQRRRSANPAYSLRAFSRKIGLSPSAFSEFRRGKRNLSPNSARKILISLGTQAHEVEDLISGLYRKKFLKNKRLNRDQEQVDEWTFKIISECTFAILSVLECGEVSWTVDNIADKLAMSPHRVQASVDRLLQLGMVRRLSNQSIVATGKSFISPDGIPCEAVRRYQANILDLARASLARDPVEARDYFSTTMAIDPLRLAEAKNMVREFHKRLSAFLEGGEQREVYTFARNFFLPAKALRSWSHEE